MSQLERMPLLKENRVPRYLFRLYSPRTVGTTSASHLAPPSATSGDPDHSRDVFALPQSEAAERLNKHLRWDWYHEPTCNFMSWTNSLLFVLQYALYRHQSRKDGSDFSDICLMVIDTRKFAPRTFVKDTEIIPVFAPFQTGYNDLQSLLQLRRSEYYFGEYLSQGDLDLAGKGIQTTFETMHFLGLFDLVPELKEQASWEMWAKRIVELRRKKFEPVSSEATQTEVRQAITIADGAFGEQWTIPISAMLLSMKSRKSNDKVITEGYKAMFSPAEFEEASLSDMYIDEDRQPELEQFCRLVRDIDCYLNPEEGLIGSFGTLGLEA